MTCAPGSTLHRAPQRQKVLAFIKGEVEAGREFPSRGTIAQFMGWKNATSVSDVLSALTHLDGVLETKWIDGKNQYFLKHPT